MPPTDRRQFLAAAGAALSLPGHSAETKIRTGILGVQHSHLAPKLEAMYHNPDFEVVSVCEPAEATRREHANDPLLSRLHWVGIDEMLHDKSLDLIVFEGVVQDAVPFGKRVLEAGKHLHLEKPPTDKMDHSVNWSKSRASVIASFN